MVGANASMLLDESELYDVIVDVVGDETSLEFCTLVDYYLEDNDLDLCMRAHGTDWDTIKPLVEDVDEKAQEVWEANDA